MSSKTRDALENSEQQPADRSVLPWLDEDEVPPCIGERYSEALRPRPMDD